MAGEAWRSPEKRERKKNTFGPVYAALLCDARRVGRVERGINKKEPCILKHPLNARQYFILWASDFSNPIVQKNYLGELTKKNGRAEGDGGCAHFKTSKSDHLSQDPSQGFLITTSGGSEVATWKTAVLKY